MKSAMTLKEVVSKKRDVALIIGNGINRFNAGPRTNSWEGLLLALWNRYADSPANEIPKGITLTEFYDALELTGNGGRSMKLQQEFCDSMDNWKPKKQHELIVRWAKDNACPILTTNFESTLAQVTQAKLHHLDSDRFTDFYPWCSYFANELLEDPLQGFGIWHINGMQQYSRSIRLGLSHYMGSVDRARGWTHGSNEARLFTGKDNSRWKGHNSWLHILFNKNLVFLGLELGPIEVFLRWLLIERAKYFKKFPDRKKQAWYVFADSFQRPGQTLFLESVGIKVIHEPDYEHLYVDPWQ